ncbi:hypothetical protein JCM8547_002798 [Rhodosporidiobolus lusitaniae]
MPVLVSSLASADFGDFRERSTPVTTRPFTLPASWVSSFLSAHPRPSQFETHMSSSGGGSVLHIVLPAVLVPLFFLFLALFILRWTKRDRRRKTVEIEGVWVIGNEEELVRDEVGEEDQLIKKKRAVDNDDKPLTPVQADPPLRRSSTFIERIDLPMRPPPAYKA